MGRRRLKLRIGPSIWTVKYTNKPIRDDDGDENYGTSEADTRTITLSTAQSAEALGDTFLHEVIHAALYESGYDRIINDDDIEEGLVRALTHTLWPLIKSRTFTDPSK